MATTVTMEHELEMARPISRLSWGGVFAGAITTIAVGFVLLSLGAAIGLTGLNPAAPPGQGGDISPIASGIWLFLSIVVATFAGAWVGTRCATYFLRRDAMVHGAVIWALSLLMAVFYMVWTGSIVARTGGQIVGSTLQTAGNLVGSVAGGTLQALPQTNIPQQLQQQLTPEQLQQLQRQLPSGEQISGQMQQAANAMTNVGAALSWWFFFTAVFALLAAVLGSVAALPDRIRRRPHLEARRQAGLRPGETHA